MVVHLNGGPVPLVRHAGNAAFAVMLLAAVVLEVVLWRRTDVRQDRWFGAGGVLALATAYAVWQLGRAGRPTCDPTALLQWHGVWHVLCAVAAYLLFRHYAAEERA